MLRLALFFFFLIAADASAPPARGLKLLSAVENRKLMRAVENSKSVALIETGVTRAGAKSVAGLISADIPLGSSPFAIVLEAQVNSKITESGERQELETGGHLQVTLKVGVGSVISFGLRIKGTYAVTLDMKNKKQSPMAATLSAIKILTMRMYRETRGLPTGKTEKEVFSDIRAMRQHVGEFSTFSKAKMIDVTTSGKGSKKAIEWRLTELGLRNLHNMNKQFLKKVLMLCDERTGTEFSTQCDAFDKNGFAQKAFLAIFAPDYTSKWNDVLKTVNCDKYKDPTDATPFEFFRFAICRISTHSGTAKSFTGESGNDVEKQAMFIKTIWGESLSLFLKEMHDTRLMYIGKSLLADMLLGIKAKKNVKLMEVADADGMFTEDATTLTPTLLLALFGNLNDLSSLLSAMAASNDDTSLTVKSLDLAAEISTFMGIAASASVALEVKAFGGVSFTSVHQGSKALDKMRVKGAVLGASLGDGIGNVLSGTLHSDNIVDKPGAAEHYWKIAASIRIPIPDAVWLYLGDGLIYKVLSDFIMTQIIGPQCNNMQSFAKWMNSKKAPLDGLATAKDRAAVKKAMAPAIKAKLADFGNWLGDLIKKDLLAYLQGKIKEDFFKKGNQKAAKELAGKKFNDFVKNFLNLFSWTAGTEVNGKLVNWAPVPKKQYFGFDISWKFSDNNPWHMESFSLVQAAVTEFSIAGTDNKITYTTGSTDTETCVAPPGAGKR